MCITHSLYISNKAVWGTNSLKVAREINEQSGGHVRYIELIRFIVLFTFPMVATGLNSGGGGGGGGGVPLMWKAALSRANSAL